MYSVRTFSTRLAIRARSIPLGAAPINSRDGEDGALAEADAARAASGRSVVAIRWSAGTLRCSTGRDSQATRFTFIRCRGPMLSEVMFPPGAPQPSVIAGNRFVEYPIAPCTGGRVHANAKRRNRFSELANGRIVLRMNRAGVPETAERQQALAKFNARGQAGHGIKRQNRRELLGRKRKGPAPPGTSGSSARDQHARRRRAP